MHILRLIIAICLTFTMFGFSVAEVRLKITKLDDKKIPAEIVLDERVPSVNGLPDGKIATAPAGSDISEAWYSEPTERYRHGVLGDRIEAGALRVKTKRGRILTLRLPKNEVFEDITPRLADLDRNGTMEVVTIRSSVTRGAAITVYGLVGNALVQKATTRHIGTSNRWLNVAGISNFTRSGTLEIAVVVTPHIGGTLKVYKYAGGILFQLGAARSFSNHVIGSRELRLSAIADFDGNRTPDLALPSGDRRSLLVMSMSGGKLSLLAKAKLPSPINKAIDASGSGANTKFTVGLEDGSVYSIHR